MSEQDRKFTDYQHVRVIQDRRIAGFVLPSSDGHIIHVRLLWINRDHVPGSQIAQFFDGELEPA